MLQKNQRLSKNKEFDHVFKTGRSFYSKSLGIKLSDNDLDVSRCGIMIGVKVSKKAVVRNRFKRQIREILQTELPKLKRGKDLVIIVLPPILEKNFQEVTELLLGGLRHLRAYR